MYIYPNYNESILNLAATLSEFLGNKSEYAKLKPLLYELAKNYKNVIFICLDGLGIHQIETHLEKDDFLRKNVKQTLTATFPSTTASGATTLFTALPPALHGWFAWCLYFKELDKVVDLYKSWDSFTREPISPDFIKKRLPKAPFYVNTKSNYNINEVLPDYADKNIPNSFHFKTFKEKIKLIDDICSKIGNQFVFCYFSNFDTLMHEQGVSSIIVKEKIKEISHQIELLFSCHKDTLIIISADHGQVDIDQHYEIYKDEQLCNLLAVPPHGDARAVFLIVKQEKTKEFENLIETSFAKSFDLLCTKELLNNGVFGCKSTIHNCLLPNYILVPKQTNIQVNLTQHSKFYKGHHSGLSPQEMYVPLILIS